MSEKYKKAVLAVVNKEILPVFQGLLNTEFVAKVEYIGVDYTRSFICHHITVTSDVDDLDLENTIAASFTVTLHKDNQSLDSCEVLQCYGGIQVMALARIVMALLKLPSQMFKVCRKYSKEEFPEFNRTFYK